MKTKQKTKKELILNDNEAIVILSTNYLAIVKSLPITSDSVDILLDGSDNNAYIVQGHIDDIHTIINICYKARENNIPALIELDGITVKFL